MFEYICKDCKKPFNRKSNYDYHVYVSKKCKNKIKNINLLIFTLQKI